MGRLYQAQRGLCFLCGQRISLAAAVGGSKGPTLEHVWPRHQIEAMRYHGQTMPPFMGRKRGTIGNALVAHGKCNSTKGHRNPYPCELIWLADVNARLGITSRVIKQHQRGSTRWTP